jgi:hypothetical protein
MVAPLARIVRGMQPGHSSRVTVLQRSNDAVRHNSMGLRRQGPPIVQRPLKCAEDRQGQLGRQAQREE